MYAGCVDRTGFLLAGGSDQRVRFWNLDRPEESCLLIPAPNDSLSSQDIIYKFVLRFYLSHPRKHIVLLDIMMISM